ncbi:MAG: cyclic nucleotide-binding domain-containing protein [Deltaproteobacteria bacterium]|nr:cyclic nucleotide-binding domain-containing protein [Deltaproteobacteria bacterium]
MSNQPKDPDKTVRCESCPLGKLAHAGHGGFCPLISRRYGEGDVIFERGGPGNYLWFVKEGRVEMQGKTPATRGPGALIGLDSLARSPYSETAVAAEDTVLCGATREGFINLLKLADDDS